MFKHILIPTDGSDLSRKAIKKGIEFAKTIKARITAVHVVPQFRVIANETFISLDERLCAAARKEGFEIAP